MININKRLNRLRKLMTERKIDAYIVNTSDPHKSEYLADRYKTRQWISGFTGSAGTVVVTAKDAILWTDGRYFIQAEKEIKDSEFKLYKMAIPGYPTYEEWLRDNLKEGDTIGFDGGTFSQKEYEDLEKKVKIKRLKLVDEFDLIDEIWNDRPEKPSTKAFLHEVKYTGKTAKEKLQEVRSIMKEEGVDYYIIGSLDDIAWLYNIRGRDVKNNPVNISYSLISMDKAVLYIDEHKLDEKIVKNLTENGVAIKSYISIMEDIKVLEADTSIYLEKEKINRSIYKELEKNRKVYSGINITTNLKAIKNKIEVENQKNAYIKDGVALVKYLYWLDMTVGKEKVTELSAAKKLRSLREEQEGFIEDSFDTISAYKENAAMMHYSATEETDKELKREGFYLVDSGGQYYDGTTDITRTVSLGKLTDEEIKDFTLTLKGHINLANARFLYGATGHSLDVLSRYPLWQEGIDYKCGTGHGIGYMLNVHEGPHRISMVPDNVILEEGMVTSIEPGVYKLNKHGIRIENIVAVKKDIETDSGQFMKFEILSYVPIDKKAINVDILSEKEIGWINNYHKKVYEKLESFLNENEKKWLEEQTSPILNKYIN